MSYDSNLDSIDENLPVARFSQSPKRRCSDNSHLFSMARPNVFPEKRQSEPTIRYAFYNKSFDILCPRPQPAKVLSQNDLSKRPFRRQISTIDEIFVDDEHSAELQQRKLKLMAPKFKCCVSDEDGRCINYDPIYHNHEVDLSEDELLRQVLCFEENFVERCEQICPQQQEQDENENEEECMDDDGGGSVASNAESPQIVNNSGKSVCDDEIIYENARVCRKCGHYTVTL